MRRFFWVKPVILSLLTFHFISTVNAKKLHVTSVSFYGNMSFNRDTLISLMDQRPSVLFWKTRYSRFELENDIQAIQIFYQSQGFIKATVKSAVKIDTAKGNVSISVMISEGKRVYIKSICISKNPVFDQTIIPQLMTRTAYPLQYLKLNSDAQYLVQELALKGYLKGVVLPVLTIDSSAYTAIVTFSVKTGPRILVKDITIKGLSTVKESIVKREISFKPRDTLTSELIRKTERNLFLTRMFNFVETTIDIQDSAQYLPPADTLVPIIISVNQADYFSLETGIGYGSYERLYFTLQLSYSNLFHRNHQITLNADMSGFDQNISTVYTLPWIFTIPVQFSASAYYNRHDTLFLAIPLGYEGAFRGFTLSLGRPVNQKFSFDLTFDYEDVIRLSVPETDSLPANVPRKSTRSIIGNLTFDQRNNLFNPTRGFLNRLSLQLAGLGGESTNQFFKIENDLRGYLTIADKFLLSSGLTLGWAFAYGSTRVVPAQYQFYGGGPTSVRGFQRNKLITTSSGDPLGGNVELIAHLFDFQFPIYWWIAGALFSDAGYIWQNLRSVTLSDIRYTAGPSLRVVTPIGMVRFDLGFQLQNLGKKDSYALYLEIGRPL
ncbi:MAG: BamA/TamA family outer membrane protein [Fibrobacter sp.]|nr:BamA/TamA family outer membrane protein [Fibrobacter sp.]